MALWLAATLALGSHRRIWIVVKPGRYDVPESRLASSSLLKNLELESFLVLS